MNKMKTTTIQLTDEQDKKISETKERLKISKSAIIRIAIDQYFGGIFE